MMETESGPVGLRVSGPVWPPGAGRTAPQDLQPSWEASPPAREDSLVAVVTCGRQQADPPCPIWKAAFWAPGARQDWVPGRGSREPLTL